MMEIEFNIGGGGQADRGCEEGGYEGGR